jgi:hypothetical protein
VDDVRLDPRFRPALPGASGAISSVSEQKAVTVDRVLNYVRRAYDRAMLRSAAMGVTVFARVRREVSLTDDLPYPPDYVVHLAVIMQRH